MDINVRHRVSMTGEESEFATALDERSLAASNQQRMGVMRKGVSAVVAGIERVVAGFVEGRARGEEVVVPVLRPRGAIRWSLKT